MKKTKKWLALILAITLLGSNAIYSLSTSMKANETESVATSEEVAATADETPKPESEEPIVVETPVPEPTEDTTQEEVTEPERTEPAVPEVTEPEGEQAPEASEEPVENKYKVIINKPESEGGLVKTWTTEEKKDIAYNAEDKFVEEVTEGTTFNFEITANEGYEVEKVTDQADNEMAPKSVDGNVSLYEILNITEETVISILYKESEESKEDTEAPKLEEEEKEEKKEDTKEEKSDSTRSATRAAKTKVTFHLNGGKGTIPQSIEGKQGEYASLPIGEGISRPGYTLLGWSTHQDSSGINDNLKPAVYDLGGTYKFPEKNEQLYAAWAQESGRGGLLTIAIRKDGVKPAEPSIQQADYSHMTYLGVRNLADYFSPIHTAVGSEAVEKALKPYFYEDVEYLNKIGGYWNPATHYVDWYVIKDQKNDSTFHIDGVVREKSKVNLDYSPNTEDYTGLEPDGAQYAPGTETVVQGQRTLQRIGWDFAGWNTSKDGSGTAYNEGDTIKLLENTTLYAMWSPKNGVEYGVEYYLQNADKTYSETPDPVVKLKATTNTKVYSATNARQFPGFTYDKDNSKNVEMATVSGDGSTVLKRYYSRNTDTPYTVEHYLEKSDGTGYALEETETGLSGVTGATVQAQPKSYEGFVFDGTIEGTVASAEIAGDGSTTLKMYYKANKVTVTFDLNGGTDSGSSEMVEYRVNYGSKLSADQPIPQPVREGYNFTGWSPILEDSATYTEDVTYTAQWNLRTDLSYTVNYLDQKTNEAIAGVNAKKVENQTFGEVINEVAMDIPGYNIVKPTTGSITIGVDSAQNVINFYYTKKTDLSYTVKYLDTEDEKAVAKEKFVENKTFGETIEEEAIEVDGYNLTDNATKSIIIKDEANEIIFYYTKMNDLSYVVNYLEEGTNEALAKAKSTAEQTYGASVTEKAIAVDGYNQVEPSVKSITIDADNSKNVINFYYTKKTDISYTVNYLEEGTNNVLATAKNVPGNTLGATYQETAKTIVGYTVVGAASQEGTIQPSNNVINFYYIARRDLTAVIEYRVDNAGQTLLQSENKYELTIGATITAEAKTFDGYVLKPNQTLTKKVEAEHTVMTIWYVPRTDLSYTVNYLEAGENGEEDIVLAPAKTLDKQTFGAKFEETAVVINGYNVVGTGSQEVEITTGTNEYTFYYTKRTDLSYTVKYLEQGTDIELRDAKVEAGQIFGAKFEEKAASIDGYNVVAPGSQEVEITTGTNEYTFYYTKKADLSYTVKYLDSRTEKAVADEKLVKNKTFGETFEEKAIDVKGYNLNDNATKNITIKDGINEIIFYYTKKNDLSYVVNYLEKGTNEPVADAKPIGDQTFGADVTETAIPVDGYNQEEPTTQSITIEADSSKNVINFYYTKRTDLSYTVKYLEQGSNETLQMAKVTDGQTFGAKFEETAVVIDGYNVVEPGSQEVEITTGTNEYTFYYTKRTDLSYTVKYLEQGSNAELAKAKSVDGQTFGAKFKETAASIDGYNIVAPGTQEVEITTGANEYTFYYTKKMDLSYTVKYLDAGTEKAVAEERFVENKTFGETFEEKAIEVDGYNLADDAKKNITIKDGINELTFYYTKKNDLSYVVNYLEKGTNEPVADAKPIGDQTFGADITETAIPVDGYNQEDPTTQSITIGADSSKNVINFYYIKRTDLSYTVKYLEQGTNAKLQEAKTLDDQTFGAKFEEIAATIDGYNVVGTGSQKVEITTGANEYTFYYTKRTDLSYTVKYIEYGTDIEVRDAKLEKEQTYLATVKESAPDITGYKPLPPLSLDIKISADNSANVMTFYYTKRADLSYTVNYLEAGVNGGPDTVLAKAKTELNQVYLSEVTEEAIDIKGYNRPENQTIEIGVADNVINFYYTKRADLSYTVNYLEAGENGKEDTVLAPAKTELNQVYLSEVTEKAIDIKGYNKPEEQTIQIGVKDNVINFYYTKKSDLSYTVKYLDTATQEAVATEKLVESKTFGDTFDEEAIEVDGYNLADDAKKIITIQDGTNELIFYYTKKNDLSYVVNYLEKGTNRAVADAKPIADQTLGATVTETASDVQGYNKEEPLEQTITIAADSSKNVINFYYMKRKDLSYTVNYLEAGENGEPDTVLAEAKTELNQVYLSEVTEEAIDIKGYNKPEAKKIVIDVADNVINFYYTKRADLSYTVNYLEAGENGEPDTVLAPAKTESNQVYLSEVTEEAIDIKGYNKPEAKKIVIDVADNVINFYYTKRADLSYTVNYLEAGENDEPDTVLAPAKTESNQVYLSEVTEEAIDITGYNKPKEQTIEIGLEDNVINFYYTKQADLSYTVNYLEAGENDEPDTVLAPAKTELNQAYLSEVTEEAIDITGYNKPENQTIEIGVEDNVINFYYTKKSDLSYTVKYLSAEDQETSLAETKTVGDQTYLTEVTEPAIDIDGYVVVGASEQTFVVKDGTNEIIFYYARRDDLAYVVNYLEQGTNEVLSEAKTQANQTFKDEITEEAVEIEGYRNIGPEKKSITISTDNEANVINFYYAKQADLSYQVRYYLDGEEAADLGYTEEGQTFESIVSSVEDKTPAGYMLERTENLPLTIGTGENVVHVYYAEDGIGEGPNPDQPDGIPDKYQVVVDYIAVNGTVSIDKTVVTLRDEEGNPSETGTGTLQNVATATANEGYAQDSLAWTDEVPTIGMMIGAATTFTATFAEAPATPDTPETPDTPTTPGTPATPDTPTAPTTTETPALVVAPPAVPAPVAAAAVVLGGPAGEAINRLIDIQETIESEDGEVPLANADLEHKCCILHFLIMLLALIVLALYTRSRKKHQQRIFELREQLEEESIRRQINNSQEQEM